MAWTALLRLAAALFAGDSIDFQYPGHIGEPHPPHFPDDLLIGRDVPRVFALQSSDARYFVTVGADDIQIAATARTAVVEKMPSWSFTRSHLVQWV